MLRNVKHLQGYAIRATDGVIGEVEDMYFDDEGWAIRYFIVGTGSWLSGRKVLISPVAIGHPDWLGLSLLASLTKAQVENSPDIETRRPVSRQHEAAYLAYYGYPHYWGGAGLWGMGAYPGDLTTAGVIEANMTARQTQAPPPGDSHLRSCRAVIGYHIHATDGDIGHVDNFIVDEHTWGIRYLVVNTSNWWVGHSMLVAPPWIKAVDWSTPKVSVVLTRHAIKSAPPYDSIAQFHAGEGTGDVRALRSFCRLDRQAAPRRGRVGPQVRPIMIRATTPMDPSVLRSRRHRLSCH